MLDDAAKGDEEIGESLVWRVGGSRDFYRAVGVLVRVRTEMAKRDMANMDIAA
jgi:hypothetical protein